jgi:quercetin dioxygenase-like cupin family protein
VNTERRDEGSQVGARQSGGRVGPKGFHHFGPSDRRPRAPRVPGSRVDVICDAQTPTASLIVGVNELAPGARIPLHFHDCEELQYILSGHGVALDAEGREYPLEPGSAVYCAAGRSAAHGFVNTGTTPLAILYVYASPRAVPPALEWLKPVR